MNTIMHPTKNQKTKRKESLINPAFGISILKRKDGYIVFCSFAEDRSKLRYNINTFSSFYKDNVPNLYEECYYSEVILDYNTYCEKNGFSKGEVSISRKYVAELKYCIRAAVMMYLKRFVKPEEAQGIAVITGNVVNIPDMSRTCCNAKDIERVNKMLNTGIHNYLVDVKATNYNTHVNEFNISIKDMLTKLMKPQHTAQTEVKPKYEEPKCTRTPESKNVCNENKQPTQKASLMPAAKARSVANETYKAALRESTIHDLNRIIEQQCSVGEFSLTLKTDVYRAVIIHAHATMQGYTVHRLKENNGELILRISW